MERGALEATECCASGVLRAVPRVGSVHIVLFLAEESASQALYMLGSFGPFLFYLWVPPSGRSVDEEQPLDSNSSFYVSSILSLSQPGLVQVYPQGGPSF